MPFGRPGILGVLGGKGIVLGAVRNYCGFSPRASNAGSILPEHHEVVRLDTAWETTFDRGPHEIWFEERGGRHHFGFGGEAVIGETAHRTLDDAKPGGSHQLDDLIG